MEEHMESKIAAAFQKKDQQKSFPNKEVLWHKIDSIRNQRKLVPVFWRAAAIIIAFFLFGSVVATIIIHTADVKKYKSAEIKNSFLQNQLDSITNLPPQILTEIQYVEKEKIIYRSTKISATKPNQLIEENTTLKTENNILQKKIQTITENYETKISSLEELLTLANQEKTETIINTKNPSKDTVIKRPQFLFKPTSVNEKLQQPIINSAPKMEVKLFKTP